MLLSENDSKVKHISKSAGHKDQNDNISENQNKELWDGKISEWFSTAVFYKTLLWLGILEKDRFHIDDKNNKHALSLIISFPGI